MKNRTSLFLLLGLFILAAIGIGSSYINDPSGFIKMIVITLLIGVVLFFVFKRFSLSNPESREQRAFIKAAKRSKKRLHQKDSTLQMRRTSSAISSVKRSLRQKKDSPHLTVIEGKKGKKKNRVSF